MELRVAQPRLGDAVHRRRRNDAAERAGNAVALVVGHDEQHVGRALGRHDARRPPGLGILGAFLDDDAAELRRRRRDLFAVDGGGRGPGLNRASGGLDPVPRSRWGTPGKSARRSKKLRAPERIVMLRVTSLP